MSRSKKKFKQTKKLTFLIVLIIILFLSILYIFYNKQSQVLTNKYNDMYTASEVPSIKLYKFELNEDNTKKLVSDKEISRGTKVIHTNNLITYEDNTYSNIIVDNKEYYININNLVNNKKDVVQEEYIYTRSATTIIEGIDNIKIKGLTKKGDKLKIIGYDKIDKNGNVNLYKVKVNDIEGYVYAKYMSNTKEDASKNYNSTIYDKIHGNIKNLYGGGEALKLDFYPNEKPKFQGNIMPDSVYALYLNCSEKVINNIDDYIEFAKDTAINTFVIDIKDNQVPAYPADIFKELSPTNYEKAINTYEEYKKAITKIKEAGFYTVGRITVFKDSYYIKDNEEDAIINKNTKEPYLHNGSYWPSAYDRDVWYFNVMLAKESVEKFGFNEINFDYVRFPDRMNSVKNIVDLKNSYNEDKVEAIQRFVQYAKDSLHSINTYISIDVFGESTNSTYTTAYGQYWPAISNEADVICGMPYPDHFAPNSYGIEKPWNNPYLLMKYWGSYANDRQKEIPTPAIARTWIQAYDVMKYVDSNSINYNAKEIEEQVRGLYESGLDGGYITWLSNSNLDKYKKQQEAFKIDYRKEYNNEERSNN